MVVAQMIEIPWQSLQKDTLINLVESFVLREGTDYGVSELSLDEKVKRVMRQLESGKIRIFFDEKEETCTLVDSQSLTSISAG